MADAPPPSPDAQDRLLERLIERLCAGDRRTLARAITTVESTHPSDRARARAILRALPDDRQAVRVGLSGTPGVGKSTFIETLGLRLAEAGKRVAVLAVDPSSQRSGGSILGDKTRMPDLTRHPNAYIRPSPSGGVLGGVARRTRETVRLVEAAGFDVVLVETVGVGQSEVMVAELTDVFLLLLAPAGGDELQGVKRGIMEIADLIVINKADGPLQPIAEATRSDYAGALSLMRRRAYDPADVPAALCVSAQTGAGIDALWDRVLALWDWRAGQGWISRRRAGQAVRALRDGLEREVMRRLADDPRVAALEAEVAAGLEDPETAALGLADRILGTR